jgi:hypothetical protein
MSQKDLTHTRRATPGLFTSGPRSRPSARFCPTGGPSGIRFDWVASIREPLIKIG